jgi:hypothetical protein
MFKKKTILVVATAGVLALGYAIVSTNAFADNTVGTTTTVTVPVTTPTPSPSTTPAPVVVPVSPLATMPSTGNDDGDVQSGNATNGDDNGENQIDNATNGDDNGENVNGDDNGDNSLSAGVTAGLTLTTDGQAGSNNDNQDSSNSND